MADINGEAGWSRLKKPRSRGALLVDKHRRRRDDIFDTVYRTLMIRGMKGCYIYCTDQRLTAFHIKAKT